MTDEQRDKFHETMLIELIKIARGRNASMPLEAETSQKLAREVLARYGESWPGRELHHDDY